jgi:hypothetical protein
VIISILTKFEFKLQEKNLWNHLASLGGLEWQSLVKKVTTNGLSYFNYDLQIND